MDGLVLGMVGSSEIDRSEDVERDLSVGRRVVDGLALAVGRRRKEENKSQLDDRRSSKVKKQRTDLVFFVES